MKRTYFILLVVLLIAIVSIGICIIPFLSYCKAEQAKNILLDADMMRIGFSSNGSLGADLTNYAHEWKSFGLNFGTYVIKTSKAYPFSVTNGMWIGKKCVYAIYGGHGQDNLLKIFPEHDAAN